MAAARASASPGSTRPAGSSQISAVAVVELVTTGVPRAMASSTGRPNPSSRLGKAKSRAAAYSPARSRAGTGPRRSTWQLAAASRPARSTPQPSGPASTSGAVVSVRAIAASRPGRFLRGSTVPTHNTNRSGSRYRARTLSTSSAPTRPAAAPRGVTRILSGSMPASAQSAAVAREGTSTMRAEVRASSRVRLKKRTPRRVKCSGRCRKARSLTVTTRAAGPGGGTAPPVAWTTSTGPVKRTTEGRRRQCQRS